MAEQFLNACISVLKAISSGELADTYVNGQSHLDAWNAFNSTWRSDKDANQALLTPYQQNILGECWFDIENSDPNPDLDPDIEGDWSVIQGRAKSLLAMLLDETADPNSRRCSLQHHKR